MASKNKSVNCTFPQRKRNPQLYSKDEAKPTIVKTPSDSEAERELSILKNFDLTLEYGPCIGITRMQRWDRADKHGLNPPAEVKIIISKYSSDELYTECLWNKYSVLK